MVRPCSKNGRRKTTQNNMKWMPKQKRAPERPKKNWMEDIGKSMNERNLNEVRWKDGKQWSLVSGNVERRS